MRLAGLSQSELARRVGVKAQAIQHLATKGQGSKKNYDIALACDVDPEWLATGSGEPRPVLFDPAMGSGSSMTVLRAIESYRHCSKEAKALIERIIVAESSQASSPELIDALTKVLDIVVPAASSNDYKALMDEIDGKDT